MQYYNIGKFIRNKRKSLKISLNKFALKCGVDSATLSNFETGKSDILFNNLIKILEGFNIDLIELLNEYKKMD